MKTSLTHLAATAAAVAAALVLAPDDPEPDPGAGRERSAETIDARSAAKRGVTGELIAGRTSLKDAARQFRALDAAAPVNDVATLRSSYRLAPDVPEEEVYFLCVLKYAQVELAPRPGTRPPGGRAGHTEGLPSDAGAWLAIDGVG